MSRVAHAVFALLVAATFAAFFVAQGLKSTPTLVSVKGTARYFSPDGDGRKDVNDFSVVVRKRDDVTVAVVDADGDEVRRLADGVPAFPYRPLRLEWDGRTDTRERAPDGVYRLRVNLRRQNRSFITRRRLELDTRAPTPRVDLAEGAAHVAGPVAGPVDVRITGASVRRIPRFRVWRTDVSPARRVAEFMGTRGSRDATWDGRIDGEPAGTGIYLVEGLVYDRASNLGSSAPGLPERPQAVRGAAGLTVRTLAIAPPTAPVRAGRRATFFVDARGRSYRWQVRRVGDGRARSRGRGRGPRLTVRAPQGVSGAYLLEVRAGRVLRSVPFLVQADERRPMLVVLPAITWLGTDLVDDDGDGLPNTLVHGDTVRTAGRVLRGERGVPPAFADDVAPLLVWLDRAGIRYDLTTDLALDRSRDPRATDREGVLLAGSLRWVSRRLAQRLREYARSGGRVATFGPDTLRRGVAVLEDRLARPTQPTAQDPFGARLAPLRRVPDPVQLTPLPGSRADHPLLTAWSGVLGGFTAFEESEPPREDAPDTVVALGQGLTEREIAEAETEQELPRTVRPALTAVELGKGLVIRVGLPQWPRRLDDPDVSQLTYNAVDLLRGVEPRPRDPVLR